MHVSQVIPLHADEFHTKALHFAESGFNFFWRQSMSHAIDLDALDEKLFLSR